MTPYAFIPMPSQASGEWTYAALGMTDTPPARWQTWNHVGTPLGERTIVEIRYMNGRYWYKFYLLPHAVKWYPEDALADVSECRKPVADCRYLNPTGPLEPLGERTAEWRSGETDYGRDYEERGRRAR